MNAQTILSLNDRALFPGDEQAVAKEFRRLSKLWHPDRNHDAQASAVFAHITAMHVLAKSRTKPLSEVFVRENGKQFRMEYLRKTVAPGCDVFLGATSIAYLVTGAHDKLSDRASARQWKFSGPQMKGEMERFLPQLRREERLQGGRMFIFNRTSDQILMSDLMTFEGVIDPKHVAWMISRLMNISCYLQYAGLSHLGIAPEFLLVSLEHHGVTLTGPSLYATEFNRHPEFAPAKTVSLVPSLRRKDYLVDSKVDRQLIRQIGRQLLGDPSGNRLRNNPDVRPEVAKWLNSAPPASAFDDYAAWESCLGQRKFVVYPKSAQQLYAAYEGVM